MFIRLWSIIWFSFFSTQGSVDIPHGDAIPGKGVPPPPSLPPPAEASSGVSNSVSKSSNNRAALLGSICNFDKNRLRRITNGHR